MSGCPKHPGGNRSCEDMRCLLTWEPPGAPTPERQLLRWANGEAICPNTRHECCPDFGCCRPKLAWSLEKRRKYVFAEQGEREKMLMGALGAAVAEAGGVAFVTRGDPADHE
jgi:hypothetical protein